MTHTLRSSRFGELELDDDAVLDFPVGLMGLGGHRYALVPHGPDSAFRWLHSLEDPALALPVTSPWAFFPDYEVRLSDDDQARLGIDDPAAAEVLVTVRAQDAGGFAANLAAPIVVVAGRGHQVLNQAPAELRAPLFG